MQSGLTNNQELWNQILNNALNNKEKKYGSMKDFALKLGPLSNDNDNFYDLYDEFDMFNSYNDDQNEQQYYGDEQYYGNQNEQQYYDDEQYYEKPIDYNSFKEYFRLNPQNEY